MKNRALVLALILASSTAGCGHADPTPLPPATPPGYEPPPPLPRPPGLRPDLDEQWFGPDRQLRPPIDDGFNAAPVQSTLQPGRLIDQFGKSGRIFSPKGEPFNQRALPTICANEPYTLYRVLKPLPVASGKALAWFGQTGGATRYKTEADADALLRDQVIEKVPVVGPPPCDAS